MRHLLTIGRAASAPTILALAVLALASAPRPAAAGEGTEPGSGPLFRPPLPVPVSQGAPEPGPAVPPGTPQPAPRTEATIVAITPPAPARVGAPASPRETGAVLAAEARPECPAARLVGSGRGFCLVN